MRAGKPITIYLSDNACKALDNEVQRRAKLDKEQGFDGYSVTNRSKLVSEVVENYLLDWSSGQLNIQKLSVIISPVLEKYEVKSADLFGSYARGEQTKDSDVDILIDEGKASGLAFFKLQNELSKILNKNVDLQSANADNKEFLSKIEKDRIQIYAA